MCDRLDVNSVTSNLHREILVDAKNTVFIYKNEVKLPFVSI